MYVQCEQMEVELHDVSPTVRPALKGRLENYRKELDRLRKEFVSVHSNKMLDIYTYMYVHVYNIFTTYCICTMYVYMYICLGHILFPTLHVYVCVHV